MGPAIERDAVVALLINLDAASPSPSTVSLFVNGERATEPQNIPEAFNDKVHMMFRQMLWLSNRIHRDFMSPLIIFLQGG